MLTKIILDEKSCYDIFFHLFPKKNLRIFCFGNIWKHLETILPQKTPSFSPVIIVTLLRLTKKIIKDIPTP
jgi:hypothetical protein